jgi:hypothetical protein
MQVQSVRFTDLRYFLSQFHYAFFDGILHDDRLAEPSEREIQKNRSRSRHTRNAPPRHSFRPVATSPNNRSLYTFSQTKVTGKSLRSHRARKAEGMLSMMYTINRIPGSPEVSLTCNKCSHTLRVNQFDDRFGSRRTQAASAMLRHVCNEQCQEPIIKPLPPTVERIVLS